MEEDFPHSFLYHRVNPWVPKSDIAWCQTMTMMTKAFFLVPFSVGLEWGGSRMVVVGNLFLAIVAISWGLLQIHSKRRWVPIVLIFLGVGWLINVMEFLILHR